MVSDRRFHFRSSHLLWGYWRLPQRFSEPAGHVESEADYYPDRRHIRNPSNEQAHALLMRLRHGRPPSRGAIDLVYSSFLGFLHAHGQVELLRQPSGGFLRRMHGDVQSLLLPTK